MLNFAFVINVSGAAPENYSVIYENDESRSIIAGVDGIEAGKAYVRELIGQGYTLINLCGDFDDDVTEEIRKDAGEGITVENARYTIDELAKLNKLESFHDYGMIVKMDGVDVPQWRRLENADCALRAVFVRDMDQAKAAALEMVRKRVDFIELCSWFDQMMMEKISDETGGKVPIGTCGRIYR